jgi:hypothetical protein
MQMNALSLLQQECDKAAQLMAPCFYSKLHAVTIQAVNVRKSVIETQNELNL